MASLDRFLKFFSHCRKLPRAIKIRQPFDRESGTFPIRQFISFIILHRFLSEGPGAAQRGSSTRHLHVEIEF
jgi:hypothetical protein